MRNVVMFDKREVKLSDRHFDTFAARCAINDTRLTLMRATCIITNEPETDTYIFAHESEVHPIVLRDRSTGALVHRNY